MKHSVKVSIIVPVYNTQMYISECLQSALKQTLKEIEIICVDDGSTDNSLEILKSFSKKDKRIIIIQQSNEGLSKARNAGLAKATGEYIMFLDSDDFLELTACEMAYNQIEKNKDDVVLFDAYEYLDKNKTRKETHSKLRFFNKFYKSGISFRFTDLNGRFLDGSEVWYKIYRKSFLDKNNIKFDYERFAEDVLFSARVIVCADTVSVLDTKLYNYRLRNNTNNCIACAVPSWQDNFTAREKAYNLIIKSGKDSLLNGFLPYHISSLLYWYDRWKKIPHFPKRKYYESLHNEFYKLRLNHKVLLKELSSGIPEYKNFKRISKENYYMSLLRKFWEIFYKKEKKGIKRNVKLLGIKFSYVHDFKKVYLKHIKEIREKVKKEQKIRVAFYVNDSKWKSQRIFDLLLKNKHYEPFILVGKNDVEPSHAEFQTPKEIDAIVNFYENKGMPVYRTYDYKNNSFIPLSKFSPDIIFYSRPWNLPRKYAPQETSRFALTCYVPYFISNSPNSVECDGYFQNELWRYYIINNEIYQEYSKTMPNGGKNLKIVGYPLLEDYLNYNPDKTNKKLVIYAPHWSVGNTMLKYATFEWNGKYILDFAKKHPEISWVFKPHPILKGQLTAENIMSAKEVEQYWKDWEQIATTYEGPDYLDLFKNSKAMITDCGSFLAEYMPTQSPVILLRNKNATSYNTLAQKVTEYYYSVWNLEELAQKLDEVIIKGQDPYKKERLKRLKELNFVTSASENILDDLNKEFNIT